MQYYIKMKIKIKRECHRYIQLKISPMNKRDDDILFQKDNSFIILLCIYSSRVKQHNLRQKPFLLKYHDRLLR